ncbi:MAG: alpha/beta hydrolase [Xanthomonadales bacterium]|nr:alpha/beta hydrolase [Xanthomonadales bacterium]
MTHRKLLRALALMIAAISLLTILTFGVVKGWRYYEYNEVGDSGIVQTEAVKIRGTTQYLFIRGYQQDKPLLLFLPGGPGESFVPLAEFSDELERDFIVVHIETGGVGKSDKYKVGPTLEEMVQDTDAIVDHLLVEFDRHALYLVGHSFGSILALKIASATPEKALGVATVGQAVDWRAGNLLTHEHLTSLARREGDGKAVIASLQLRILSLAITAGGQPMIDFSAVKIQRQWLEHFNIGNVLQKHTAKVRWFTYLISPNHSVVESCELAYIGPCKWIANPQWWSQWKNIIPGILQFNAINDIPELKVPYVAIVGSDDWITPKALTRQYYETLTDPKTLH